MTLREALREGAAALTGSETPFLDASLLLGDLLSLDAGALHAAAPRSLSEAELDAFRLRLAARAAGAPVAYILGRKDFWGREFLVDGRVLVPRPDTELLVEAGLGLGDAWSLVGGAAPRVHEACCGSGCVALSIAAERPAWPVSASDLSEAALEVAAANGAALLEGGRPGGPVALLRSDLLAGALGPFDLILANPPYVPTAEAERLLDQGWGEPRLALDGGLDGFDLLRRLPPQAASRLAPGGWLLVEADGGQAGELRALFAAAGFVEVETLPDLAGRPRVTRGQVPGGGIPKDGGPAVPAGEGSPAWTS
jgi:release factor glutamine methyltransferase